MLLCLYAGRAVALSDTFADHAQYPFLFKGFSFVVNVKNDVLLNYILRLSHSRSKPAYG